MRQAYIITSIICFSQAKKRSNFFSLVVDIYFMGSDVKKRVFKTLTGFGLCYSYYSANYIIGNIAEEVKIC